MRRRKQRTMKVENGPTLFSTHNKALKRQSFLHTQIYRIRSFRRTSDIEDAGKADSDSGVLTAPPNRGKRSKRHRSAEKPSL